MNEFDDLPMERWPEEQLLRAAHAGNAEAFKIFCEKCLPSLTRLLAWKCRQYNLPRDLVKDFAQDVIVRALSEIRTSEEESQPLPRISPAWLFSIGDHLVVDYARREKRRAGAYQQRAERLRAESPSQEELDRYEEAREYFDWLQGDARDILEFVLVEGMTPAEAGAKMGLSKAASHKAYWRAHRRLADIIQQHSSVARKT